MDENMQGLCQWLNKDMVIVVGLLALVVVTVWLVDSIQESIYRRRERRENTRKQLRNSGR